MKAYIGGAEVEIFTQLGEQIQDVTTSLREIFKRKGQKDLEGKPRIGMQMWFDTPAFLVDLFRKVNPQFELVSSDPVMDAMRAIKDPQEVELMAAAQRIATLGMNRVWDLLKPGVTAHELATEALWWSSTLRHKSKAIAPTWRGLLSWASPMKSSPGFLKLIRPWSRGLAR